MIVVIQVKVTKPVSRLNESTKVYKDNIKLPKSDVVKWKKITKQWEDSPGRKWGSPYEGTAETGHREGICYLSSILKYPGTNGERRQWRDVKLKSGKSDKAFGTYVSDKWYQFLDDIKANGIQEPLMLFVDKSGKVSLAEGNHRREAAIQLGLKEVPIEVKYFGDIQLTITDFLNTKEDK